jgi:hypothetical protein
MAWKIEGEESGIVAKDNCRSYVTAAGRSGAVNVVGAAENKKLRAVRPGAEGKLSDQNLRVAVRL